MPGYLNGKDAWHTICMYINMKIYDPNKRKARYRKNRKKELKKAKERYRDNREKLKADALARYYIEHEKNKKKNRDRMRKKRALEKQKRSTVKIDVSKKHNSKKIEEK